MVEEKKIIEIKKEIQSILKKKNELFILNNITVDIITDTLLNYFIVFEKENYFAEIIVGKEEYAPYKFIYFDMIGENDKIPEILYTWFDNEETTIQDIIENINKALDYFITY
ncbi:hypothetical protein LDJ99_09040 [Fusobacterium nucleatum]|uniref:hypothetical protein n=1 Tax=Fusobacterium nucleatum TaxID=851 RepID=UPI001EEE0A52|nr:hypothetical protein [Fusobacterium nucleatum]MCG6842219.1 hypothetical protein [Fusobacterium nucleatum]